MICRCFTHVMFSAAAPHATVFGLKQGEFCAGEENRQASEVLEVQNHIAHSHIPDAQRLAVIDTSGTDLQHEREQV